MITALLAQAAANPPPADTMLSGNWVISLIVALFAAASGSGVRAATGKREITNDPLRTLSVSEYATRADLDRIEKAIDELRDEVRTALDNERTTAREALGKVHQRIDLVSASTSEIKGELKSISGNLELLLNRSIPNRRA